MLQRNSEKTLGGVDTMTTQEFAQWLEENTNSGMHEIVRDWDNETKSLEKWLIYLIETMSQVMEDLSA